MDHATQRTAIMGFGNPCRSDDAIGIYILDQLRTALGSSPDENIAPPNTKNTEIGIFDTVPNAGITFFDMGTSAFEVLFALRGHTRIIIADAVINTGEPDGTLYHLPASAVEAAIQHDPMVFLHSLKWDQALSYARKILRDDYPKDISVYLVAVSDTRLEMQLSETVKNAGDKIVSLIIENLSNPVHGIPQ